jgi:hypothetical protein
VAFFAAESRRAFAVYRVMRLAILVLLLAVGCSGPASFVGRPEAELRGAMGAPLAEYRAADGSRTLAFSYGHYSGQTYMADVDPGGTVRGVRQALVEENFQRIDSGMTRDEVLRLIGPPVDSMAFPRRREVSWEYRFIDAWGYRALFYVNFDERGLVVSKLTRRIENDRFPLR